MGATREDLMRFWESSWQILFENVEPLTLEDFSKTVNIRGEPHSIVEAINRQLTHSCVPYRPDRISCKALAFGRLEDTQHSEEIDLAEFNKLLSEKQR